MAINIEKNVFTEEEINELNKSVESELLSRETVEWDDSTMGNTHPESLVRIKRQSLGRREINNLPISQSIKTKVFWLAQKMHNLSGSFPKNISGVTYVEYSPKYGVPELNIHKDNGTCGFILDYQLDANTTWGIGIEDSVYTIENNQAIGLHPLTHYHWRPSKDWKDDDYVKLIFFEFFTPGVEAVEDLEAKERTQKFISSMTKGDNK